MSQPFEQRLGASFERLPETLRNAGSYLMDHPVDTATRSLRALAQASGQSPAAFSRLAKALDYDGFAELKDEFRAKIDRRYDSFSDKAARLQDIHGTDRHGFMPAHLAACLSNLDELASQLDYKVLDQVVETLFRARNVYIVGALGSTGLAEYLLYMANFCAGNWHLLGRAGASIGSGVAQMNARDVLIVVTKPPYVPRVVKTAELAHGHGAHVVVITDSPACPAIKHSDDALIVPSDSPNFFSSYVATLFLVETLIGMFVSRAGAAARTRIAEVEKTNQLLTETWDGQQK